MEIFVHNPDLMQVNVMFAAQVILLILIHLIESKWTIDLLIPSCFLEQRCTLIFKKANMSGEHLLFQQFNLAISGIFILYEE